MHENRETSGTSRPNRDRDQSEKAIGRTADRNVSEESDRAVVPVNLSNKEEQSSAEAGEERARAKENIVQSNTSPTQSGERVNQGLRACNTSLTTSQVRALLAPRTLLNQSRLVLLRLLTVSLAQHRMTIR
jgi:hypothetical protein